MNLTDAKTILRTNGYLSPMINFVGAEKHFPAQLSESQFSPSGYEIDIEFIRKVIYEKSMPFECDLVRDFTFEDIYIYNGTGRAVADRVGWIRDNHAYISYFAASGKGLVCESDEDVVAYLNMLNDVTDLRTSYVKKIDMYEKKFEIMCESNAE